MEVQISFFFSTVSCSRPELLWDLPSGLNAYIFLPDHTSKSKFPFCSQLSSSCDLMGIFCYLGLQLFSQAVPDNPCNLQDNLQVLEVLYHLLLHLVEDCRRLRQ